VRRQNQVGLAFLRPAGELAEVVQAVAVDEQPQTFQFQECLDDRPQARALTQAGADGEHVVLLGGVQNGVDGLGGNPAGGVLGQGQRRVGRLDARDDRQGALGRRDPHEPRAGPQRRPPDQGRRPRHADAAGDHKDPAERALV
jgi:hypothetical protein